MNHSFSVIGIYKKQNYVLNNTKTGVRAATAAAARKRLLDQLNETARVLEDTRSKDSTRIILGGGE